MIPKRLEEALPYASKPKDTRKKNKKGYIAKRAVIMEKDESKQNSFIQALKALRKAKTATQKSKKQEKRDLKAKREAKKEALLDDMRKVRKRQQYRAAGKLEKQREAKRLKKSND